MRGAISLAKGNFSIDAAFQSDVGRRDYRNDRAMIGFTKTF